MDEVLRQRTGADVNTLNQPAPVMCLDPQDDPNCYDYELFGVTVHTGTADGGHYYSYIRQPASGIFSLLLKCKLHAYI